MQQVKRADVWHNFTKKLEQSSAALCQAAAMGAGFLIGGGSVFGGVTPLGLALVIGCPQGYLLACALGVLVSGMVFFPVVTALRMAAAVFTATGARLVVHKKFWPGAVCGVGTLLAVQLLLSISGTSTAAEACQVLGTSALALAAGRELSREGSTPIRRSCLWLSMLAVGTQNLALGFLQPGAALLVFSGAVFAAQGTLEQTAAVTISAGFALAAAQGNLTFAVPACALGALAAAALAPGERIACAVWVAGGCVLGALLAPNAAWMVGFLLSAAAGLGVYLCVPARVLARFCPEKSLPVLQGSPSGAAGRLNRVADSLAEVGGIIEKIYSGLPPRGENYNWVMDYVAESLCRTCEMREECWVRRYGSTADGFQRLKPFLEQGGCVAVEQLPGQFSLCIHQPQLCAAVSSGYELYRSRREARIRAGTLRAAITEQYGAIAQAMTQLADQMGGTGFADPHKAARVQKLFARLGLEPLECSVQSDVLGRLQASVTLTRSAFNPEDLAALADEVGRICHRSMDPPVQSSCRTVTTLTFREKPVFYPEFGMASRPAGEVSGDCVDQFCDVFGKAQMILCDGMGTGKPAAVDGLLAAHLTGKLLRAGFAADSAARLVNVALSLKSDEESSATLDVLSVDLYTGRAALFKAGAAPSFLVREGECRPIEGASLPVGVLEKVVGRRRVFPLREGDVMVLVSDGLLTDGGNWLAEQLSLSVLAGKTPQQVADILADAAQNRVGSSTRRDDITVAVCRLGKNG